MLMNQHLRDAQSVVVAVARCALLLLEKDDSDVVDSAAMSILGSSGAANHSDAYYRVQWMLVRLHLRCTQANLYDIDHPFVGIVELPAFVALCS